MHDMSKKMLKKKKSKSERKEINQIKCSVNTDLFTFLYFVLKYYFAIQKHEVFLKTINLMRVITGKQNVGCNSFPFFSSL